MTKAALFTTIGFIFVGLVDLAFVVWGGTGTSISNFLINAGVYSVPFVLGLGFVLGHLYGPMYEDTPDAKVAHENRKKRDLFVMLGSFVIYEALRRIAIYVWGLI